MMKYQCLLFILLSPLILAQSNLDYNDISDKTVVIRLEPQGKLPNFLKTMEKPKTLEISTPSKQETFQKPNNQLLQKVEEVISNRPKMMQPNNLMQTNLQQGVNQQNVHLPPLTQNQPAPRQLGAPTLTALPPGVPPPAVVAQNPILGQQVNGLGQQFVPRDIATVPPPPPVNIPPDVQNQLIKFFGLDSFGIPGLTGNHPNGFAGAVQELRAAGIPVQGLPLEHINGGQTFQAPQNDVLAKANPSFRNELNDLVNEARSGGPFHSGGNVPLPDPKPGENGLIGLLSSSIRKLVKDSGVAEALSQGIPNVLGTGGADKGTPLTENTAANTDAQSVTEDKVSVAKLDDSSLRNRDVRRQQTASQRAVNSLVAALGGGGNGPAHAGLPRVPGLPILPGGIPRNAQGQIDVVNLIGSITRRISNGTTLADVLPPEQLQTLADNVTDALLPPTPENFDLAKFMGRWFEGINSPRATEQRCVVHHYGGLTQNEKTATFTALKIYREGSEFGQVRYAIGYAFRGGNKDAMLQLHTSENADAQPFWIYKLGPEGTDPFGNKQYEYAIVSNWVKYPVTVLVRDPDTFKSKYEPEVLRWLEDQGFINGFVRAFNLIQPSSYSSCQYADSTFELFGKK